MRILLLVLEGPSSISCVAQGMILLFWMDTNKAPWVVRLAFRAVLLTGTVLTIDAAKSGLGSSGCHSDGCVESNGYWFCPAGTGHDAAPNRPENVQPLWDALQKDLASLSSNSQQSVAPHIGHDIQPDRPDLAIAAIQSVWQQAR